jgi:hypothetical protein
MKNKVLVLGVVFSLLVCSENMMAKERRGAELMITKTDGQQIAGELIAVKPSSLLLLDSKTGADVSIEIEDIAVIKITKKSKAWIGGAFGFAVGSLAGISIGALIDSIAEEDGGGLSFGSFISIVAIFGAISAIPGMLIGAILGADKTIQIEGRPPEKIKPVLEKLRSQARITNFQ